jgi:hypothetical protein
MIPVVMEEGCLDTSTWQGPVGAYLAKKMYINMASHDAMVNNMTALVAAIRNAISVRLPHQITISTPRTLIAPVP